MTTLICLIGKLVLSYNGAPKTNSYDDVAYQQFIVLDGMYAVPTGG